MPQNAQVVALNCSTIRNKMRKSFKTLSEFKLKFKAWKWETIARRTPLKGSSLKLFLLFKPDNLIELLKNMGGCFMGRCVYLGFFSTSTKRNK